MGGAKKKIQKIIPKEIKPALPAIAAIGLPYLAGTGAFGGKIATLAAKSPGIAAAIANAATQAATQDKFDIKSAALSGLQAGVGAKLQGAQISGAPKTSAFLQKAGEFLNPAEAANLARAGGVPLTSSGDGIMTGLKTASAIGKASLPVATRDTAKYAIEMNEEALRKYNQQLQDQGIRDKAARRQSIFDIYVGAGYDKDYVDSVLDKYGYAEGGRVGYEEGGIAALLLDFLKKKEDEEDEFNLGKFSSGIEGIKSGYEIATGQPLMGMKPQSTRFGLANGGTPNVMSIRKTIAELIQSGVIDEEDIEEAIAQMKNRAMTSMRAPGMADGGLMNLRAGGMPAEMDMRGGGFIPIGRKERADDVPARLSKNEFVMTADAVRGAGEGSIEKGAKRMYQTMKRLEAKS